MVKVCTVIVALLGANLLAQVHFGKAQMSVPGVAGILELDPGPTTWQSRVRPDGKETQLRAMDRRDGLMITAFLQKIDFPASPEKCRAEWWPGTEKGFEEHGVRIEDLQQSSRAGMALMDFIVPEFQGKPAHQKSVHAYLGGRDLCAEIHLSKVRFAPEDQKLFDAVLATVRFAPEQTVQPAAETGGHVAAAPGDRSSDQDTSARVSQYMSEGSRFYLQRNYPAAAERYQKVLDMEKQKRTLSKTFFRVLVDNLGMSYGISGNLAKAKETFEYGISQDPEYPLFYYNMACTFGEMGKKDEALQQLRLTYRYRANMIPGETLPDPLTDDSFRKFVSDKAFVAAVKEMQK